MRSFFALLYLPVPPGEVALIYLFWLQLGMQMQQSPILPGQPCAAARGPCKGVGYTLTGKGEGCSTRSAKPSWCMRWHVTDQPDTPQGSGACHAAQASKSKRFGTKIWSMLLPCLHVTSANASFTLCTSLYKSRVKPCHLLHQIGVVCILQGDHQGWEGTPSSCLCQLEVAGM